MLLVIELLQKELERQNLLIASNERVKQSNKEFPMFAHLESTFYEQVYPNMVQLRDQIEDAIAYLNAKNNG